MRKLFTTLLLFSLGWGLQAQISSYPYFQNFEGGAAGWASGGTSSTWAFGTPNKTNISGASSGSNAWVTGGLTGIYNNNENSYVESPFFNFSSLTLPFVEMDVYWETEFSWDGANLQASTDSGLTWTQIGAFGDPNNWYNDNTITGAPGGSQEGWSGSATNSGSAGWVLAKHDLFSLAGEPDVLFRVYFGSDGSVNGFDGFAFDDFHIYQPPPYDLQVLGLTAPSLPACSFTNAETVTIQFRNSGSSPVNYTDVQVAFTMVGPPNTGPVLNTLTQTGTIAPGDTVTYTFTSTANMSNLGNYLAYIGVGFTTSSGVTDANPGNNLDTLLLQPGLSGTYTINSGSATGGTNYASFTDAVDALNTFGVCGPVVFNVTANSGPYTEQVSLGYVDGSSSTNTITFDGGATKERITYGASTAAARHVIQLDGARHIILKNLTISNTANANAIGVHLLNQADSNMIDGCRVMMDSTTTTGTVGGIIASQTSAFGLTATGDPADHTTIKNTLVNGGYYNVLFYGPSITVHNTGNRVDSCELRNAWYYSIYSYSQDNSNYIGNRIWQQPGGTFGYGMYLYYNDYLNVIGNELYNLKYYGIYIFRTNYNIGSGVGVSRIVNNMIANDPGTASSAGYGIFLTSNCYDVRIWHNSVSLPGGTNNLRALYMSMSSPSGIDIRNNSFAVFKAGSSNYAVYATTASLAGITNFDYNNYYTLDTSVVLFMGANSGAGSITTAGGANSYFGDPTYISNGTDLHSKFIQLDNRGDNTVGVGIDIDGDSRPIGTSTTVDIGADEYTPPQADAGITQLLQPTLPVCPGSTDVIVTIINTGLDTLNSVTVNWTLNGTTQPDTGLTGLLLLTGDTLAVNLGMINIVGNQVYDLIIYTSGPNGVADEDNNNDTLKFIGLRTGLAAGNYTIDSGTATGGSNYQSFADAVSDLNTFGVCGPVVFNVVAGSGPYNETVIMGEVQGTSLTNTITFNGGATQETVFVNTSNVTYRGVFNLVGADYVTIKNLTLINYDATTAAGVLLRDQADNNTIDSCVIVLDTARTSTSFGLAGIVASAPTFTTSSVSSNESANNLTVTNNLIQGGTYGVIMYYLNTTTYGSGNVIRFNRIEDVYFYGIYSYFQDAPLITNNEITLRAPVGGANPFNYGLWVYYSEAAKIIANNIVGANYTGIICFQSNWGGGTPTARGQIINNMVSGESVNNNPYGIFISSNNANIDIFHNSVSMTNGSPRALYVSSTLVSGLDIRNNAFTNFNSSSGYSVYLASASNASQMNYNCLYNEGYTNLIYIAGTSYDSSNFKGASGFNAASFAGDPGYNDIYSDLHAGKSGVLWDRGNNAAGVADDIDGDTRPGFATFIVDVGADEFEPPAIQGTLIGFTTPSSGCGLTDSTVVGMAFRNSGLDTLYSVNFTYVLNSGTPVTETYTDTIIPNQSITFLFAATANMQTIATYNLDGWIVVTGDTCNFDDSVLNYEVVAVPTITTYPYVQDFENGAGGWTAEGNAEWELGQPNNTVIDTASSGLNAWVTDLDNLYENSACGYVISPCFDFTSLGLPEVSLAVWWNSEASWDGMALQSTTDNGATWVNVGAVGDPNNWYNDNSVYGLGTFGCSSSTNEDGWAGRGTTGSGGWLQATHEVPSLAGEPGVRFRLYFGSDPSVQDEGVAFDDFSIRDLPPIDVGATKLISPKAGQCGDSVIAVQVEIENFGSAAQTNIPVRVRIDSSGFLLATLNATYTDTLAVKGVDTVTVGVFNSYRGGTYQFSAFTLQTGDADNTNDSILNINRSIVGIPFPPNVLGDTSCAADSFLLTVVPDSGVTYAWFDSIGGMPIQIGDSLQTPFLTTSRTYYVSAFAPQVGDSLVTTLAAGNGCGGGNMFDITALSSFDLDGVSISLSVGTGTSTPVNVYFIPSGTFVGNETNATAWTLHASGTIVSNGTGAGILTRFNFTNPLPLTAGVTYGIYVEAPVNYTTGAFPTANADLTFTPGVGLCSSFGGTNNPRTFNGVLHYSSSGCNGDVAAVNAVISSPPPVDLGPDVATCGDVILDAGTGWSTYDWNTGDNTQTITVTQTGVYSVTITNQDGCIGSDTINVITNPNPPVELGADTTVCGAYLLDAGNPGASWTWQDGSNSQTYLATNSGLYFVEVVNATTGCATIDSVQLVINAIPPVDLGIDRTECDQVVLDAGNPGLPTVWSTGATTQTITVTTSGQYFVDVTDPASGCVGQDTVNLGVAPSPTVALGADTVICDGDVLLLDAGNPGSTFTWSSGGSGQTEVVSGSGTYTVLVTDVNGCEGTDTIMVDVAPPAVADFNVNQVAFTYTFNFFSNAMGSGNLSYSWNFGDNNTSTQESPSHTYGFEGNYVVCLTVTDECGSDEYCDTITVSLTNAIDDGLLAGAIDLFPSPTDGKVFVKIQDLDADVDVAITDMTGRTIQTRRILRFEQNQAIEFDLTEEAEGVYLVRFEAEGRRLLRKVVLER